MRSRSDIPKQKDKILLWINQELPKSVICKNLKCKPETLEGHLLKMGISYRGNTGRRGYIRRPIEDYLNNLVPIKSNELKIKLFNAKLKEEKCEECDIVDWMNKPVTFELHHEDGNSDNNNLHNLKILCPNCHTQTKGFRKKKYVTTENQRVQLVQNCVSVDNLS